MTERDERPRVSALGWPRALYARVGACARWAVHGHFRGHRNGHPAGHHGQDRLDTVDTRSVRGVFAAMVAAAAAATAVGFWLSYGGLHSFAVNAGGMSGPEAWAWPASVDLFIIAGEAGVTLSMLRHQRDRIAWCYLILAVAVSVTGNVLHVHPGALPWAKYAVAATPPIAAMLALAALLRHVYRLALAAHPAVPEKRTPAVSKPVTVTVPETVNGHDPSVLPSLREIMRTEHVGQEKARQRLEELAMANGNGKH